MREIKFRCWTGQMMEEWSHIQAWESLGFHLGTQSEFKWMQYTGLKDKNGKEIYEGDIFRIEEDEEDFIFYVVIVWVQEWCMFATLRVDDEYQAYLNGGVKVLDEPMFWTYTLEDTNSRKHYLCGNIYENPELVKK